jgi:hypothetical protein
MEYLRELFTPLFEEVVRQMAEDPAGLIYTIVIYMSPLFLISLICSFILMKDIEKNEKKGLLLRYIPSLSLSLLFFLQS